MCGIFGQVSKTKIDKKNLISLVKHSKQRGLDSSGLLFFDETKYKVYRANYDIEKLIKKVKPFESNIVLGHSRLITNGFEDNQPVVKDDISVIHNGIILNDDELWSDLKTKRELKIDTEIITAIAKEQLKLGTKIEKIPFEILRVCKGVISCALLFVKEGKLLLFSNNGSLYVAKTDAGIYFASESYALTSIGCSENKQIKDEVYTIDIPKTKEPIFIDDKKSSSINLIPDFNYNKNENELLFFKEHKLKRCKKCILPETMPFIKFDLDGICNYCHNYKPRNNPKPKEELFNIIESYRKSGKKLDCIVPFSGGRDSCYGLHLIVNELKMKPVTYTYDWGMVTDLGRRNISLMCSKLGVENIIVAADISQKRKNIKMNLEAWLKSPHLGMMALLTAGDKHFFRHVETIKKQTGVNLNLWGVNPLEVTHFKTGFLGIAPDFEEKKVYSHGVLKQLKYHIKRFRTMCESPAYFNSSLWDTLSGEYYRSFIEKKDYFHIFDYWRWDENIVNETLISEYNWETAIDTTTTWRIGDGTAAFYNYIYYTVAGFTEHDTFRSNQIREGQLTRDEALILVNKENQPRYENIKWYLDILGMDFREVIDIINNIPKLYRLD